MGGVSYFINIFQGIRSGRPVRGDDLPHAEEGFPHILHHLHDLCHRVFTR